MASSRRQDDAQKRPLQDEKDNEASGAFDLEDEEDWDDVEPDEEEQQVLCLFEDATFPSVQSMLDHCKSTHNLDLAGGCRDMALDFYGKIKLVNFIRSQVRSGNPPSAIPEKSVFQDEKYLQPVVEDDALLYNVDEVADDQAQPQGISQSVDVQDTKALLARVAELEEEVQRLQSQFTDFKLAVKGILDERLEAQAAELPSSAADAESDRHSEADTSYFKSYSFHEIHETMLQDTVRTDAYRDFIYDNKHLFREKVVLDVGCGTGILSMFCAKAGAKSVFAVDNSEIMNKARQNVFENNLENIITCVKGKIEEVILPVDKVDIIVSEWMGYCLLYEAMLDSVIWARDRYLTPDGLMVPSHVTLNLTALSDPDYIASHISYWYSVYGFSMTSMLSTIHDDVLIRQVSPDNIASTCATFLQLPLHSVTKEDLDFSKAFEVTLSKDIDALDGWVVWFDVLFATSRNTPIPGQSPANKKPIDEPQTTSQHQPPQESDRNEDYQGDLAVSFTTGPYGPETHWKQAVLLIDHGEARPHEIHAGQKITGTIDYRKPKKNSRDLDIEIAWRMHGRDDVGGVDGEVVVGEWDKEGDRGRGSSDADGRIDAGDAADGGNGAGEEEEEEGNRDEDKGKAKETKEEMGMGMEMEKGKRKKQTWFMR